MSRHILSFSSGLGQAIRRQVSFVRRDLLLDTEAVHPATGEIFDLPLRGENALVGPAIAHTLVRRVVPTDALAEHHRTAAAAAGGGVLPTYVALWTLLDVADLWRTEDPPPPREPSVAGEDREPEHPFKPQLVTGGTRATDVETDGWIPVKKSSTVWVSDGAFRLAAAMHGSPDDGSKRIGVLAAQAWERDLQRCLELHTLVSAAPDGLLETAEVQALRPASSVSQEVEKQVLDEALVWLGVDPSAELKRTPGRKKAGTEAGILAIDVDDDGRVHGHLCRSYNCWPAETPLTGIALPHLIELLGLLRMEKHGNDADLLEAYLDAAHPTWRDVAADEPADATTASDPWEVLGLQRGASRDEVVAAYRSMMKRVHPDVSGLPPWVSRAVADAYRNVREAA